MVQSDYSIISTRAQHPRTRFCLLDLRPRWDDCFPMAGAYPGTWARREHFVGVQRRIVSAVPAQPFHCFFAGKRSSWSVNFAERKSLPAGLTPALRVLL